MGMKTIISMFFLILAFQISTSFAYNCGSIVYLEAESEPSTPCALRRPNSSIGVDSAVSTIRADFVAISDWKFIKFRRMLSIN